MATIICPGCFDLLHEGHKAFLHAASRLGGFDYNALIVCVNTDDSAIALKYKKWGDRYPVNDLETRIAKLTAFGRISGLYLRTMSFNTESELCTIIRNQMPCIIAKGPDYLGKKITGGEIAPILLLNTPETNSIREMKLKTYARV